MRMRAHQKPSGPGFTWNIDRNHHQLGARLRRHIDEELKRLRRHLQKFPQDAVHLLITFRKSEAHAVRYEVALVLKMPSNVLRAKASSANDLMALTLATTKLHRQLEGFKSHLRHEREWKKNDRNQISNRLPSR